jgi:hypothetical protein
VDAEQAVSRRATAEDLWHLATARAALVESDAPGDVVRGLDARLRAALGVVSEEGLAELLDHAAARTADVVPIGR